MTRSLSGRTIVALAIFVSACGVGSSESVEEIEPEILARLEGTTSTSTTTSIVTATSEATETTPEDNSGPSDSGMAETSVVSTTTTEATTTTIETETFELYFTDGTQLVPLDVELSAQVSVRGRLAGLEAGPPPDDQEAGIRTAVPVDLIEGVDIRGDQITVDLDGEVFNGVESPDQLHLFGQIVLTLTGEAGFDSVLFTVDGERKRVFRGDNSISEPDEAVTREDYEVLLDEGPERL